MTLTSRANLEALGGVAAGRVDAVRGRDAEDDDGVDLQGRQHLEERGALEAAVGRLVI